MVQRRRFFFLRITLTVTLVFVISLQADRLLAERVQSEGPILVFAAASLADVAEELGAAFEEHSRQANLPTQVRFNFAGSNTLARQIEAGAPADLFLSAHVALCEEIVEQELARPEDLKRWFSNSLVVVVSARANGSAVQVPSDLLQFDRLALADPEGVPAGIYAKSWLASQGVWNRLERRVVPLLDVRAAIAAVGSGALPAAVVYATDAASHQGVRVVYSVRGEQAPSIDYATLKLARSRGGAVDRLEAFLHSQEAQDIWLHHGFEPKS